MVNLTRLFGKKHKATAYCPVCGKALSYDASTCPNCAADITKWNAAGFVDKLVAALKHPLADIRMRAIIVLGNRREPRAAEPLLECALSHPTDVIEGLAIVDSLAKIREVTKSDAELKRLVVEHGARAVREAAKRALGQT